MHHCAKFHQNWSIRCRDITIIQFQDDGCLPYSIFKLHLFPAQQGPEVQRGSSYQISSKMVNRFLRYRTFLDFQLGGRRPIIARTESHVGASDRRRPCTNARY